MDQGRTLRTIVALLCVIPPRVVVAGLLILPLWGQAPPALAAGAKEKLPEPPLLDRKEAEKAIRKTYQEDYSRRTPEGLRALAEKLLGKAKESRGAPAQCYVFLVEARDLAAAAPDARLALEAVEEMAGVFQVNRTEMRRAALSDAMKSVRTPEAARSVAQGLLGLLSDATAADDYDGGKKVITAALGLSRTAKDAALAAAVQELGAELAEAQKRWPAAKAAEKTLETAPDDREANLASGKFLCFVKNDWAKGLKRLEKGSDAALARAAHDDVLDPQEPAFRVALGNSWWSLGEKRPGLDGFALRQRGARWLAAAMEDLDPVERDGVLPRLEALVGEVPSQRLAWQGAERPAGFVVARFNGKDGRGWTVLDGTWKFGAMISSDSRDSKDETNRYLRSSLMANWIQVHFEFRGGNPGLYLSPSAESTKGLGTNLGQDGKWNEIKVDVDMNRWNTVKLQRTGGSMKVYLNDKLYNSFSPGPSYVLLKAQRGDLRVRKLFAFGYN